MCAGNDTASMSSGSVTSPQLRDIVERFWAWRMRDAPEFADVCGIHEPDVLDERSLESFEARGIVADEVLWIAWFFR